MSYWFKVIAVQKNFGMKRLLQNCTNSYKCLLTEKKAELLTSNHVENFQKHLKFFKENGHERVILTKDIKEDGNHRIYTIAIFSDQRSYNKCSLLLKKYAELVEPSKSELPQKMISKVSIVLHDTDS